MAKEKIYNYRVKKGTHRYGGKVYRAGKDFKSTEDLSHIKNKLIDLDRLAPPKPPEPEYLIKKFGSQFVVIGADREIVSEKATSKKSCEELIDSLLNPSTEDDAGT